MPWSWAQATALFVVLLQQAAVHLVGEEGGVLVAHVVVPEDGVEVVASVPDHVEMLDAPVEIRVEHVLHPLGLLDHGDEHGLGAHGPGVGHVEAEPEHALDPVALLLPFGVVLLQALPVDAVLGDGHPGLGLFPGLGGGETVKSRNSGVESCSLNCFMVTPHSLVTMR